MSDTKAGKIIEIAGLLGVNPQWLDALINFETGGTYNPTIKNPVSSARGLIQVIDSTARSDFGFPDSLSLVTEYSDFDSQMDNVVYPYLKKYMPYTNKQSLYMAVFYPAFRNVSPDTKFPESVTKVNPGINTPQDYIDFVDKRIMVDRLVLKASPLLALALLGVGAALWARKKKLF